MPANWHVLQMSCFRHRIVSQHYRQIQHLPYKIYFIDELIFFRGKKNILE